jgi:DNA-binding transcriptional LysR family regulator
MTAPHSLPPLRLLGVFQAVAAQRSLSLAARTLNVSQPAVSKSLRELEQWVGAPLLDRSCRPIGLTQAGETLLAATRDGLGLIADALAAITRAQAERAQTLRLSCSIGFATYWLMPRLAAFNAAHPAIAVSVLTTPHDAAPDAPHADAQFRYGHGQWRDGSVISLFEERITPVASPAFLATRAVTQGDLSHVPLIHVDVDNATWRTWSGYLASTGQTRRQPGPDLRFNTYVQATQAALAGQGVMLGWRSITADLVSQGQLATAALPAITPEDGLYCLVIPPHSADSPAVIAFRDWLIALLANEAGA